MQANDICVVSLTMTQIRRASTDPPPPPPPPSFAIYSTVSSFFLLSISTSSSISYIRHTGRDLLLYQSEHPAEFKVVSQGDRKNRSKWNAHSVSQVSPSPATINREPYHLFCPLLLDRIHFVILLLFSLSSLLP